MKTLSFRFDVDTAIDVERGVPKLLHMGRELHVRFSFYVNMGKAFDMQLYATSRGRSMLTRLLRREELKSSRAARVSTFRKLGVLGALGTVIRNGKVGVTYREELLRLMHDGHELGLHGGMNHALWQHSLHRLTEKQIERLFSQAYDSFCANFRRPLGFCSPGFVYNDCVLDLLDRYGFLYASDMEGKSPFHPVSGNRQYSHIQIPVNIIGNGKASFISQQLALGVGREEIVKRTFGAILERKVAIVYGHPSIEGHRACSILKEVILRAKEAQYDIVPLRDLVSQ